MEIACELECGHIIDWGENPSIPGACIPWSGLAIYCPECEQNKDIVVVIPSQIEIKEIIFSGPGISNLGCSKPTDLASIFFDTNNLSWCYCLHGINYEGLVYESDNFCGFTSVEETEEEAYKEYRKHTMLGRKMKPGTNWS